MAVPFGRDPTRQDTEGPGSDNERPVRTGQDLGERLDGPAVRFAGPEKIPGKCEVMFEGGGESRHRRRRRHCAGSRDHRGCRDAGSRRRGEAPAEESERASPTT